MNRSSMIALGVLAAVLAYFLSFGADSTKKLQAGFLLASLSLPQDRFWDQEVDHVCQHGVEDIGGGGT